MNNQLNKTEIKEVGQIRSLRGINTYYFDATSFNASASNSARQISGRGRTNLIDSVVLAGGSIMIAYRYNRMERR
jgi:hypothetical protein